LARLLIKTKKVSDFSSKISNSLQPTFFGAGCMLSVSPSFALRTGRGLEACGGGGSGGVAGRVSSESSASFCS
jgi:hypothetical protein